MTAYSGPKKSVKINIMVSLKSLLLCEALCKALGREMNGYKMLAAPALQPPADFRPDLILVDFVNLRQSLILKWPDSKILLIDTGLPEEDTANLMCSYKLFGVISPEEDFQQFRKALHVIQDGQIWIDNAKLKAILHGKNVSTGGGMVESLSKKETQIIELVAEGYKNKEIAAMLFLSEQTIKSHLGRIFKKIHVTNRSQLVSLTIKNKILNP
jgi:DNA-binding NarL/FixJ family response regulator